MDSLRLEYARKRRGRSKADMAKLIKKSLNSYTKKEAGQVGFTDEEKLLITADLNLTAEEFDAIFYDGNLPKR